MLRVCTISNTESIRRNEMVYFLIMIRSLSTIVATRLAAWAGHDDIVEAKRAARAKNAGIETCTIVQFDGKLCSRLPKNYGKFHAPESDVGKINSLRDYSRAYVPAYSI